MSEENIENADTTSPLAKAGKRDVATIDRDSLSISESTKEWLDTSEVTIGHAVEFVRASEQQTDAEVALWRCLLNDRTSVYREIVRALIDAEDEFNSGERSKTTLTYDELEARLDRDLSRPQLSERVSTLDEGSVVQRGGMPRTIAFENKDVALLARIILTKAAPRV